MRLLASDMEMFTNFEPRVSLSAPRILFLLI